MSKNFGIFASFYLALEHREGYAVKLYMNEISLDNSTIRNYNDSAVKEKQA